MKIVKKSGQNDDFNINKALISVYGAAIDISYILNESDLKIIKKDILDKLQFLSRDFNYTSVYEVKMIIYEILHLRGFTEVAKSYISI